MRTLFCAAVCAIIVGIAERAQAETGGASANAGTKGTAPGASESQRAGFLPQGWFLHVGANVGVAYHPHGMSGTVLGGEASWALFPVGHGFWNGVYVDGVYDFGRQRVRASPGLEFGYLFMGVDGGPVFDAGKAPLRFGFEVRPMFSLGVVHVYGRWGWLFGDAQDDHFREVGVLLKFPIQLMDSKPSVVFRAELPSRFLRASPEVGVTSLP